MNLFKRRKKMKTGSGFFMNCAVLAVSIALMAAGPAAAGFAGAQGHGMAMHHQHLMMNHALGMTLEGSNLVMLGEMGMAGGIDKASVEHGKMMIKNGRDLWNELMSGETMMKMHSAGTTPADDPTMKYTHQLAEAQLKVMDLLSKMPSSSETGHGMTMHHQHIMLNHALKMGLEGSNIIMLGQMGMEPGVDTISVKHGKSMMENANMLLNELMSGETMMEMHGKGMTPEKDKTMGYTHQLAEAQMNVMNLLKKMPSMM
jgi:hypothetical protein